MSNVSFLGLGVMGYPIAGHLARAGFNVTVFNRTIEKAKKWAKEYSCSFRSSVSETVRESDFVFSCVGNDNDIRNIIYGQEGAFNNMKKGACFIDHTTASYSIANELVIKAQELGISFIDAPVSGGEIGDAPIGPEADCIIVHAPLATLSEEISALLSMLSPNGVLFTVEPTPPVGEREDSDPEVVGFNSWMELIRTTNETHHLAFSPLFGGTIVAWLARQD